MRESNSHKTSRSISRPIKKAAQARWDESPVRSVNGGKIKQVAGLLLILFVLLLSAGNSTAASLAGNPGEPPSISPLPEPSPKSTKKYALLVSNSPDRLHPIPLEGVTVSDDIYVFVNPESGISQVRIFLDDPAMKRAPRQIEGRAPYDFEGTGPNLSANPFDTTTAPDGTHSITAAIDLRGGSSLVLHSEFTVFNNVPRLVFSSGTLSFPADAGGHTQTISVNTNNGATTSFVLRDDADWLTLTPETGATPETLVVSVDASGLSLGAHTATITAATEGLKNAVLKVDLIVATPFSEKCRLPSIVQCVDFDSAAQWSRRIVPPWKTREIRGKIVTDMKAEGAASLRFLVPSRSGADTSGAFRNKFTKPDGTPFRKGEDFYIQWKQRFSKEFLRTRFKSDGWKQIIIFRHNASASCDELQTVMSNVYFRGLPQVYGRCGRQPYGIQSAAGCTRRLYKDRGFPEPPCVRYKSDQWMTFQFHVRLGDAGKANSLVEVWVDGKLVVRKPDALFRYNQEEGEGFGQYMLTAYQTHKDYAQTHATSYVWYDSLIIATEKIPD